MGTNETIEVNDLALTENQQVAVKGGPVVMQDCLVSSYQSGGHEGGANTYGGLTTVNEGIVSLGSQHTTGINVCLGDGSVR